MQKRIIHQWKNWILVYVGEGKYELTQKDNLSVHTVIAKDAMDAENQCRQIISNTAEEGV